MILSIDPSTTKAGYALWSDDGLLEKSGVIKSCNLKDGGAGLTEAIAELSRIINSGPYMIHTIVVEKMFVMGGKNGRQNVNAKLPLDSQFSAGALVGAAIGISNSMASTEPAGIKIVTVMPRSWQAFTIGGKGITKAMIREKAEQLYNKKFQNDQADAVLIGCWYIHKGRVH